MNAEDVARLAARGGFELTPERCELVARELTPLWSQIGRLATRPMGSTEPAMVFSPAWPDARRSPFSEQDSDDAG